MKVHDLGIYEADGLGILHETPQEEDVFRVLGLDYIAPKDRV